MQVMILVVFYIDYMFLNGFAKLSIYDRGWLKAVFQFDFLVIIFEYFEIVSVESVEVEVFKFDRVLSLSWKIIL